MHKTNNGLLQFLLVYGNKTKETIVFKTGTANSAQNSGQPPIKQYP